MHDCIHFDDFEAGISVIDWAELNRIHAKSDEGLKYLGNHFGENGKVYACFAGDGILKAVLICK